MYKGYVRVRVNWMICMDECSLEHLVSIMYQRSDFADKALNRKQVSNKPAVF